ADGDAVQIDDPLLELETDKATVEIPADTSGVLKVLQPQGATVQVGDVVARIEDGAAARKAPPAAGAAASENPAAPAKAAPAPAPSVAAEPPARPPTPPDGTPFPSGALSPAVRRLIEEHGVDPRAVKATGRGGRLTKEDVLAHLASPPAAPPTPPAPAADAP